MTVTAQGRMIYLRAALTKYLLRIFIFWLLFFAACRIAFLISVTRFTSNAPTMHSLRSLFAGFYLDLSTIGYLTALTIFPALLNYIFQKKFLGKIHDIILFILIIIYSLTAAGELALYQEWTSKLTMQALIHFQHPAEVFQSATIGLTVLFFSLAIGFSVLGIFLYRKFFKINFEIESRRFLKAIIFLIVFIPLNFIIIRGGWQAIPISESDAYYSNNHVLNDAAVNPAWSLVHNIMEYRTHQEENPYVFMPEEEADKLMKDLFSVEKDTTEYFLKTEKPNIVFLLLESYSSFALPYFGGDNYAPFLDSISRQGIAFTKCYPAGYASDQGIPAILSSYPSTPRIAITNQTSKSLKLPCINKDLKPLGYESGFIFGGQLNYGNIRSYLFNMQFDVLKEKSDFPSSLSSGHLGIHDRVFAPYAVEELNKAHAPFMYAWFTLSSHSPYDIPEPKQKLTEKQNDFMNTVVYTDHAIKDFFDAARKQPWFSNTLFVVVSDHSHHNQHEFDIETKDYHQIVCFFFGDVIKEEFRGGKVEKITSQLDIVPTLLKQFNLKTNAYSFGKDMLNPYTKHFAYYDHHGGSGFITDSCYVAQRKNQKELSHNTCMDSSTTKQLSNYHHAFLQKAFEDYLRR